VTKPMLLDLHFPTTLQDRISREFTHIGRSELVNLSGTRILFEKMGGSEVELKGIICMVSLGIFLTTLAYRSRARHSVRP
jgi:hypothetical protein